MYTSSVQQHNIYVSFKFNLIFKHEYIVIEFTILQIYIWLFKHCLDRTDVGILVVELRRYLVRMGSKLEHLII